MAFQKRKFRRLWIFGSYSLIFHLSIFLLLLITIGKTHKVFPSSSSSPITIRLVDSRPPENPSTQKMSREKSYPKLEVSTGTVQKNSAHGTPSFFKIHPSFPLVSQATQPLSKSTPHLLDSFIRTVIKPSWPNADSHSLSPVSILPDQRVSTKRILRDQKPYSQFPHYTPVKILHNPTPPYPKIARELGLEGKTILRVEVLEDGRPGIIHIKHSCGYSVLDEAAARAIKDWKFAPAKDGVFTVRSVVDLPIRFSLTS